MISKTNKTLPLVVLEGLKDQNRFYSTNTQGEDPTIVNDGSVAYKVLAYCETSDEAQAVIEADGYNSLVHHFAQHLEEYKRIGMSIETLQALEAPDHFARLARTSPQTLLDARNVLQDNA